MATTIDGIGRNIAEVKIDNERVYPISHTEAVVYKEGAQGSGQFLDEKLNDVDNSIDSLDGRLSSVEELAEIFIEGGTIQIGNNASDITSGSSKVPTGNAVYGKMGELSAEIRKIPFALPQHIDLYPGETTSVNIFLSPGMQLLLYAETVEGTDQGDDIDFQIEVGAGEYAVNSSFDVVQGYNYYNILSGSSDENEKAAQYQGIRSLKIESLETSGEGKHIVGWIMPIYNMPLANNVSRGLMSKEQVVKLNGDVSAKEVQSFTNAEKEQARENIGASGADDLKELESEIKDTYARKDGFYETMGVGTAVNLAGQQDRSNSDKFRTSGGSEDIATGTARLESIKGNAIAWNQYRNVTNGYSNISNGITITYQNGIYTVSGTQTSANTNTRPLLNIDDNSYFIEGHKYALMLTDVRGLNQNVYIRDNFGGNTPITTSSYIFTHTQSRARFALYFWDNASEVHTAEDIQFCANYFDLTLIYGIGNEPSTVAQFEADYQRWFGRALGYEPYDAGSLKPVLMTGYKTVGFNLLDPETGKAHLVGTYGNTNVEQGLYCYEISGNYTSITDEEGNTITPNANGYFMVDTPQEITVAGADEETCIHLTWSGWRNGETELHWNEVKQMPITTLTGKLNGEGSSVVVFPDGMKSAGDVFDEIKVENGVVKAVKRIDSVDLGSFTWSRKDNTETNSSYTCKIPQMRDVGTNNFLTAGYVNRGRGNYDSTICGMSTGWYSGGNGRNVYISNDIYHVGLSASAFKTAMSGVMLYYELNTPEEYILDNFELPIRFKVDDFGTEEQVGEGINAILTCKYGVNAVDVLRRLPQNYISAESMDNFLTKLGVAMNGVWSKSWNENTQEYDFTFLANGDEPESVTNNQEEA